MRFIKQKKSGRMQIEVTRLSLCPYAFVNLNTETDVPPSLRKIYFLAVLVCMKLHNQTPLI